MPRTQLQLGVEVDKIVDGLLAAVDAWREVSHAQLVHADPEDIDAITVGGRQLRRAVEAYQAKAKADNEAAAAAEVQRRRELVPAPLDRKVHKPIYRKYAHVLGADHSRLYSCPKADADGVCRVHPNPTRHCNPAPQSKIKKHIEAQHIRGEAQRDLYKDYAEGVNERWIE